MGAAGQPAARLDRRRAAADRGRARPVRHQGEQVGRGRRHPGGTASGRCGCGGGATAATGPRSCCRAARSIPRTAGARTRRSPLQPTDPASHPAPPATVSPAPTRSMTSSSRSTTTRGRASPAAAAPCSFTWRGRFRPHRRLRRHAGTRAPTPGAAARTKHENRDSPLSGLHNPAHPPADAGLARPVFLLCMGLFLEKLPLAGEISPDTPRVVRLLRPC